MPGVLCWGVEAGKRFPGGSLLAAFQENVARELTFGGVASERLHAEEFGFANIGRAGSAEELPPGPLRSDPKLLASLAALAFAGPALAVTLLITTYVLARGR